MKNHLQILPIFLLSLFLTCIPHLQASTMHPNLYAKLCEVNAEWMKQNDAPAALHQLLPIRNEHEAIRTHLRLVEQVLRSRNIPQNTNERERNLANLHEYMQAGAFPQNNRYPIRLPIFIDDFDNFCAVGYLIKASGHEALARRISSCMNLSYILDMQDAELSQWVQSCGLTLDELAWIQPGYPPNTIFNSMNGGTSAAVSVVTADGDGSIFVGGAYLEAGGSLNRGITLWKNNGGVYEWESMGSGIVGDVRAVVRFGNVVFAGGEFTPTGAPNPINIGKWNGTQWEDAGALYGKVNCLAEYNGVLYAGGQFVNGGPAQLFSNFAKWNGTEWEAAGGTVNGEIHAFKVHDGKLYGGGLFSQAGTVPAENIFSFDGTQFAAVGNGIGAQVRSLEIHENKLHAAGDMRHLADTFGLARLDGATWERLLTQYSGIVIADAAYISSMVSFGSYLVLGGKFSYYPLIGYFGENLARYSNNYFDGLGVMNHPVNSLCKWGNRLYVGGQFTDLGASNVDYISFAELSYTEIESQKDKIEALINIYPNPVKTVLNISINNFIKNNYGNIIIYNIVGKEVFNCNYIKSGINMIDVGFLKPGCYSVALFIGNERSLMQKMMVY